ncbi:hypothetical protein [Flaviflexus massiliensis]|uniref:hypothetical protein n=1 Tax=Flaviflexus massiliensis TaxID=1522309 RepID=UPI0006D5A2B5|nr:hypothetical protein [Flaviflexus massiliensis]
MPKLDIFKRLIPKVGTSPATSDGPARIDHALEDLSRTTHAVVEVANRAEADTIASTLKAGPNPSEAFPFVVWRKDERTLDLMEYNQGWEQIGGRRHGMSASVARRTQPKTVTELHVEQFTRVSNGWNLSGGNFVVPTTGMWLIRMYGNVEGITASTAGDRFFAYQVNGVTKQHFDIARTADGGMDLYPLTKGDVVKFVGYHDTGSDGSSSGGRIMRAEVIMAQISDISWTSVG